MSTKQTRPHSSANWGKSWINMVQSLLARFCWRLHHYKPPLVKLPKDQGVVVVANHISGLDPILMVLACDRPLRFLIAKEEYERFGLQWFFKQIGCIPVDRRARPEVALWAAKRALAAGEAIALFPQGKIHTETQQPPLKKGAAWLAMQGAYPVVPLHIRGVAGVGKTLGAIVTPSPQAELIAHPPLQCQQDSKHCLAQMQQQILSAN